MSRHCSPQCIIDIPHSVYVVIIPHGILVDIVPNSVCVDIIPNSVCIDIIPHSVLFVCNLKVHLTSSKYTESDPVP